MEIIKIVIVPIGAALLHDYLKTASLHKGRKRVYRIVSICAVWLIALPLDCYFCKTILLDQALLQSVEIVWLFCRSSSCWCVVSFVTSTSFPKLDNIMPFISMFGIIYFTTVTTAAGRDNLMKVGLLLFIASVIHNAAGYFFGYWLSRLFGWIKILAAPLPLKLVCKMVAWHRALQAAWASWALLVCPLQCLVHG